MGNQEQELEQLTETVRQRIEEILGGTSYYLVDVSVRGWPGTRSVEVYVDDDDGITLEATAELTHEIRFVLDADEVFADDYTLHVSSPGADRPLVHPRQFSKHVGRKLSVDFKLEHEETVRQISGELIAADTEQIVLMDRGTGKEKEIPYVTIKEATVQLPW
jgi:ribosome maturation factor RimP